MPGHLQREGLWVLLSEGVVPIPLGRFVSIPAGERKLACTECGVTGYGQEVPTVETLAPWQVAHCFDHRYGCLCGVRLLSPGAVASHLGAMRRRGQADGHGWWAP
jgi:hypothetical protein